MIFVLAAQMVSVAGTPDDCLKPLTRGEQQQDDAGRASRSRAGSLIVLEPDDDQLPANAPADFKPQLVRVSYLIGSNGRVSDCIVDKASAIAAFNSASCELLSKQLQVGDQTQSPKRQKAAVNWTPRALLPQRRLCNNNHGTVPISTDRWINSAVFQGTQVQAGSALVALDVGATGRMEKCAIRSANVDRVLQRNLCTMAIQHAVVLPAVDAAGSPTPATLTFVVRFKIAG